jgi:hypothetical protein
MTPKKISYVVIFAMLVFSVHLLSADDSAKGPKIEFEESSFDWGTVQQGSQVKHIFKFKNVGSDTLKIDRVKTSCGCTAAESSKVIAPNEFGQIDVTFNTGTRKGKASKTVYVYSNDVEASRRSVVIHGMIEADPSSEAKK